MLRYIVSLAILVIGLGWLAVGAPVGGTFDDVMAQISDGPAVVPAGVEACDISEPGCLERQPDPPPRHTDQRITDLLAREEIPRTFLADLAEGTDYWTNFTIFEPSHGDNVAMIELVFARPVSFEGDVPSASAPCDGVGDEGDVPEDHPCLEAPREYSERTIAFSGRVIHLQVDLDRGEVINVSPLVFPDEVIDEMIEYFSSMPEAQ